MVNKLPIASCSGHAPRPSGNVYSGQKFDAASALLNYLLGVGAQNAAMASWVTQGTDRTEVLDMVASLWTSLDTDEYPFLRSIAAQLRAHDDRAEFLAGVDLIQVGITSTAPRRETASARPTHFRYYAGAP
ncbi:hypothetical protein GCM10023107_69250 [Actinoplanes octamycinicus]|nr:hypothetical protein Aoc01nite_26160 [Actinoplanes octamycinicus]